MRWDTNKLTKQRLTDLEDKPMVAEGRMKEGTVRGVRDGRVHTAYI